MRQRIFSSQRVLTEIGAAFTTESQVKVYYNFAASTTLQRQLEKGASAEGLLLETDSRHDLLTNRLVLVSHEIEIAGLSVETPDDLTTPEISRIAIGHPDIVPAGTYAKEALTHLGLWETLHPKLVFGVDVRATLAYVTAGNVDVAVVYKTDTTLSENIKVLYQFPLEAYTPIVYPAVVMKSSPRKQLARIFIEHLQSADSTVIFEKHGFTVLALK